MNCTFRFAWLFVLVHLIVFILSSSVISGHVNGFAPRTKHWNVIKGAAALFQKPTDVIQVKYFRELTWTNLNFWKHHGFILKFVYWKVHNFIFDWSLFSKRYHMHIWEVMLTNFTRVLGQFKDQLEHMHCVLQSREVNISKWWDKQPCGSQTTHFDLKICIYDVVPWGIKVVIKYNNYITTFGKYTMWSFRFSHFGVLTDLFMHWGLGKVENIL